MKVIRLLKPSLFIYEFIRIVILVNLLVLQVKDTSFLTKALLASPGALFPLMALFIWLDTDRYKAYLPLFLAGKGIGIFTLLGWSIITQQVTILWEFGDTVIIAELLLLSGDFFALAVVLFIIKDFQKITETPKITDGAVDGEER